MNRELKHHEQSLEEVAFRAQNDLAPEVEVLRIEQLLHRALDHDVTKPQRIHFHAMLLVEGGISTHEVDFERHPAGPGSLIIIPAGQVQAFAPERDLSGYMAIYTPTFLEQTEANVRTLPEASHAVRSAGPCIPLNDASFSSARHAVKSLAGHTQAPCLPFANQKIAAAFALLMFTLAGLPEVVGSAANQKPQDALVARFVRLLEDHYTSEHRASFYAEALRVSLRTLDRYLVATHAQTTRQAISSRLILEAKRLLTRRNMLIKHVAYELGFSEPQNFTRFFRSQTGSSPLDFRGSLDD